ncbi:hypothetical protein N7541_011882 [Penicillium brevicompactum]|uniref:Uncharacterized protein n=1 Tax=Penicillium brevicompactum TaxID=5074 RepID=A0A9W9QX61_PENBR|nr:hypothetical protein N7541_011882 [Penicillium brevicompactum]
MSESPIGPPQLSVTFSESGIMTESQGFSSPVGLDETGGRSNTKRLRQGGDDSAALHRHGEENGTSLNAEALNDDGGDARPPRKRLKHTAGWHDARKTNQGYLRQQKMFAEMSWFWSMGWALKYLDVEPHR